MRAVILAAGQGQRLADPPGAAQCLRKWAEPRSFGTSSRPWRRSAVGSDNVVIVVGGVGQDQIRESVGTMVHDDVLVMNSDLFFHPALVSRLLAHKGNALLYDSGCGEEEQMKVRVTDGHLVEISKALPSDLVCGENVGMLNQQRDPLGGSP